LTLALLIWQGWNQGLSQVTIYNGLPAAVTVTADSQAVTVPPFGHRALRLRPGSEYEFTATAGHQTLEQFRQRLASRPATEIYNVARAAPLVEWRSPRSEQPGGSLEFFLGRPRWLITQATVLFEEPPENRPKLVLSGYGAAAPTEMLASFPDPAERVELARLHARHTPLTDPRFPAWLALLPEEEREALLRERRPGEPDQTAVPPEIPDLLELMEEGYVYAPRPGPPS